MSSGGGGGGGVGVSTTVQGRQDAEIRPTERAPPSAEGAGRGGGIMQGWLRRHAEGRACRTAGCLGAGRRAAMIYGEVIQTEGQVKVFILEHSDTDYVLRVLGLIF